MKTTHDFKGHCQYCGRIQAVLNDTGRMSKHGYTKTMGFFNGVCGGQDAASLKQDRSVIDASVPVWRGEADRLDQRAADLRAGTVIPKQIERRVPNGYRYDTVMVAFADATAREQEDFVNTLAWQADSRARSLRAHAVAMLRLADAVHGQALIANAEKNAPVKRQIQVGDVVPIHGVACTVLAIEDRVARGMGPALNGHIVPHVKFENERGVFFYPVKRIRLPKAA